MVIECIGGVVFVGAAGVLAGKVPKAMKDTTLSVLNVGKNKAVLLPAYGEYTYEKRNEKDSSWWLYYGRDEESGYDGYTLTLNGANLDEYTNRQGIFADGDLHIRLLGENTIGAGTEKPEQAIAFAGELLLTGSGSLRASAKTAALAAENGNLLLYASVGAEAGKAVSIAEGMLYLEEGCMEFSGRVAVPGLQCARNLQIVSARGEAGENVENPLVGPDGFYGKKDSPVYVKIGDTVEKPVVMPVSGSEVEAGDEVTVSCPTWGAEIVCSEDGSDPFAAGEALFSPLTAKEGIRFRLGAKKAGLKNSEVIEADYRIRKHTLQFALDGETWGEALAKSRGEGIELPQPPEKEGYHFAGWKDVPETMPAEDLTINGNYQPNKYVFTCMLGDKVYARDTYLYGSSVKTPASPARFGYNFSGWGEIPKKMPAGDVTLKGSWAAKKFRFCCMLDGKVYAADTYGYETSVKVPASPARLGYTFSGWGEIPKKMPAEDVTLYGTMQVHVHTLTYTVDGETVSCEDAAFGTPLCAKDIPEREGYTFSGWSRIPQTMPDEDVEIRGFFTVNTYQALWTLNGDILHEAAVNYGEALPVFEQPQAEGHTFTGWENIPETMPAADLVFTGSLKPNRYTLTASVDGAVYAKEQYLYGGSVKIPVSPAKRGYEFSGWGEIPKKMPAGDVALTGKWTKKKFRFSCVVDGAVYASDLYAYEAGIKTPASPFKRGYTFSGWSNVPAKMPAEDVVAEGKFTVNSYKLTYKVDGEVYKEAEIAFGADVKAEAEPAKAGYTFSGWSNVPAKMPAEDVVAEGKFTVNSYKLTYKVDGETYKEAEIAFGADVKAEAEPAKVGYSFSGWSNVPAKMPAENVVAEGKFTVNSYKLTYKVDGEVYKETAVAFGADVKAEAEPAKVGYTFSGWSNVPAKMPAEDVVAEGKFTVNSYKLTYKVDGEVYKEAEIAFGADMKAEAEPAKVGYTFSGWSDVPAKMPAEDVVAEGKFTVNSYKLTYKVDGETYKEAEIAFGADVKAEAEPAKAGYTFSGWSNVPAKMPAEDVVAEGKFTVNSYKLTYQLDEETALEENYAFGAAVPVPKEPEADGKAFEGWDSPIPAVMPAEDVTVHACWRIIPVDLTLESITCSVEEACVGEEIVWKVNAAGGAGGYSYRYHVNKDGKKLVNSEFTEQAEFSFQPQEAGVYRVRVYVKDGQDKQVTGISGNLKVKKGKAAAEAEKAEEPLAIEMIQADCAAVAVGQPIHWKAAAKGGSGEYIYRYHVLQNGNKVEATEFIKENEYSYTPQEPGVYCVRLFVKNKNKKGKQVTKQSAAVKAGQDA